MYLDSKCVDAEVIGSAAPSDLAPPVFVSRALREMAGMIQAAIFSC
jgi:hypothetical protein